jgi:hypothetical protein
MMPATNPITMIQMMFDTTISRALMPAPALRARGLSQSPASCRRAGTDRCCAEGRVKGITSL